MILDAKKNKNLLKIISIYYDKDSFFINSFNSEILNKINNILSSNMISSYFTQDNNTQINKNLNEILFTLNCENLKNDNLENYLILMKYINTFGEESIAFIKVLLHLYCIETKKISNISEIKIKLKIFTPSELFLIEPNQNLKINYFIQFYGRIISISMLKKLNTRINYICTNCGIILSKKITLTNFKKENIDFHKCEELINVSEFNPKTIFEYTEPIYIRYVIIEFQDQKILGLIEEEDYSSELLNCNLKFSGIVKTKYQTDKNENFYIKYIKIIQIEKDFNNQMINNENCYFNNIQNFNFNDLGFISKISNMLNLKNKFSFCYNRLIPKIDYCNICFFYYLFSLSENNSEYNLKIHFINMSKNNLSCLKNIKRLFNLFPNLFKFYSNEIKSPPSKLENDTFINYPNSHLIINNFENKNLTPEIKNTIKLLYNDEIAFSNNKSNICNIILNSNPEKSLFTFSENFDINLNGYDIISIIHDINDSTNDRKKSNMIIKEEFSYNKKKRNYNSILMEETQLNKIDLINNFTDDLFTMDTMSINDYFKNQIIIEENENLDFDYPSMLEYITFVNKYINPKIDDCNFNDIYILSEHIKSQFQELQNFSLFDINWICIETLQKISKISARIEMRENVIKSDIIKAYFITKEFLQQNYVYYLINKKGKGNNIKGKKGKVNYVMDKIRQYIQINGKNISINDIKNFGLLSSNEYDDIIEKLNYEGILVKLNNQEYEISL